MRGPLLLLEQYAVDVLPNLILVSWAHEPGNVILLPNAYFHPKMGFRMCKRSAALALLAALTLSLRLLAQSPSLAIQVDHPTAKVSPTLYGLMTEEINFSYDRGLYAELIRDRTIGSDWQALAHWTLVARGNSVADVSVDQTTGPSAALPRSLKVSVTSATEAAPAGVQNDGFWGIPVRPWTSYRGSFYAKTDSAHRSRAE